MVLVPGAFDVLPHSRRLQVAITKHHIAHHALWSFGPIFFCHTRETESDIVVVPPTVGFFRRGHSVRLARGKTVTATSTPTVRLGPKELRHGENNERPTN